MQRQVNQWTKLAFLSWPVIFKRQAVCKSRDEILTFVLMLFEILIVWSSRNSNGLKAFWFLLNRAATRNSINIRLLLFRYILYVCCSFFKRKFFFKKGKRLWVFKGCLVAVKLIITSYLKVSISFQCKCVWFCGYRTSMAQLNIQLWSEKHGFNQKNKIWN